MESNLILLIGVIFIVITPFLGENFRGSKSIMIALKVLIMVLGLFTIHLSNRAKAKEAKDELITKNQQLKSKIEDLKNLWKSDKLSEINSLVEYEMLPKIEEFHPFIFKLSDLKRNREKNIEEIKKLHKDEKFLDEKYKVFFNKLKTKAKELGDQDLINQCDVFYKSYENFYISNH